MQRGRTKQIVVAQAAGTLAYPRDVRRLFTVWAVCLVVVTVGGSLLPTPASASGSWSVVPGTVRNWFEPSSITCLPESATCIAVGGNFRRSQVFVQSDASGNWATMPNSWPRKGAFYAAYLYGISCPSATFCVAVGNVQTESQDLTEPLVAEWSGGSWRYRDLTVSTSNAGYILTSVSCASPSSCIAVGRVGSGSNFSHNLVETFNGTTWSETLLVNPGTEPDDIGGLTGVSCWGVGDCVAVGFYSTDASDLQGFSEELSHGSWVLRATPALSGSNALSGVACVSTWCAAVGDQGGQRDTLVETGPVGSWSALGDGSVGALSAVSCLSKDVCAAVGTSNGRVITTLADSGAWEVGPSLRPYSDAQNVGGVACASAISCVAVGWGLAENLVGFFVAGSIQRP